MSSEKVLVPDLGDIEDVEVVEVLVSAGDRVAVEDSLITLESDKASMDVPSPLAGKVVEVKVTAGDKVSTGDLILTLEAVEEAVGEEAAQSSEPLPEAEEAAPAAAEPVAPKRAPETTPATASPKPELPTADLQTEVLVVGSGPGGYTAAFRAADLGKKVILVERYAELGGVCLNVGCIPSKALLHVAGVIEAAADLGEHGVDFGKPKLDLDRLRVWKDEVVGRLVQGVASMAKKRQVHVLQGTGRLTSPHTLAVETDEGETTVAFEAAILAVGSRALELPGIPYDDPWVMGSTRALLLEEIPERLLLVGGGIIGLEMAMVYGSLGSELTVVELLDGLIPGCDRDLVRPLERRLKKRYGARIYLETRVTEIVAQKRGLKALLEGEGAPASATFERVLMAVGRQPNGDRIGAEAAGVELDERGTIPVDRQQRTNVHHIYAIGDVTGEPMLAHRATHQGKVAAEVAAGGKSAFDAQVIPSVAYTDPEIAWVGLTETEAAAKGIAYEKGSFPWGASGRAIGMGRDEGLTKILFDPATRRVLGAGAVGVHAGDLVAELALAIEMDCEAADLALTVHPHPTLSETVAFAAEVFEGTVTDLYLLRKQRG